MSVRARRILKVEYAEPSFNLWHDEKLVQFIDSECDSGFYSQMNSNGGGVICIEASVIKKAIENAEELGLDENTVALLRVDVEAVGEDGSIDYDCF